MGGTDVYGGEKCALERLGLGDPRPRLDVGVERDGDGRQDADDRDDDHQLDQGEASLVAETQMSSVPKPKHMLLLCGLSSSQIAALPPLGRGATRRRTGGSAEEREAPRGGR